MNLLRTLVVAAVVVAFAAAPAAAQDSRHARWDRYNAGPAESDSVRALLNELNKLVDKAEKERAADTGFLRDLRHLARRYDRPWHVLLLSDNFRDGDFTDNPTWTVSSGRYWVESGYGLRSTVMANTSAQAQQGGSQDADQRASGRDLAIAILGNILNQSGGQQRQGREQAQAPAEPTQAAIHVAKTISNAFAIRLELISSVKEGRIEFGPYQGAARASGYRLVYRPDATPGLELLRVSPRGTSVVYNHAATIAIKDQRVHVLEWTRDSFDEMTVSLDGKELIRVTDRGFHDRFDGFEMVNWGGDFVLTRIRIDGTQ